MLCFSKFSCLFELRICFCLIIIQWVVRMRSFQRALVGFNNLWIHWIFREVNWVSCSKIPTAPLQMDSWAKYLGGRFNSSLFSSCLKMIDVTPLRKRGKKDLKEKYRPVSIPPIFSKVFERSMFTQMSSLCYSFLSKQQCGFRKGYSTQQWFLALLGKWKRAVDSGQMFGYDYH